MAGKIEILGTYPDGEFLAKVDTGKKVFHILYSDLMNAVLVHEQVDYFTRFAVFYENDESKHKEMLRKLKGAQIQDASGKGLGKVLSEFLETR